MLEMYYLVGKWCFKVNLWPEPQLTFHLLRFSPVQIMSASSNSAAAIATLQLQVASLTSNTNNYWLIWAGSLALLMQVGFMCLEVGSVRVKNTKNILLKVCAYVNQVNYVLCVVRVISILTHKSSFKTFRCTSAPFLRRIASSPQFLTLFFFFLIPWNFF